MSLFKHVILKEPLSIVRWFAIFYLGSLLLVSCKQKDNNHSLDKVTKSLFSRIKETDLNKDLQNSFFFRNPNGFYIFLTKTHLVIITEDSTDLDLKFMLHFVKENNTFDNYSFQFSDKELKANIKGFRAVKIKMPKTNFLKIRLGQYVETKNVWAQEFHPDEIRANPLLKYESESNSNQ